VHELRARGITILFVSHAIADVKAIGDRALWLEQGRIREIGETDHVVAKYLAAMVEKDSAYLMLKSAPERARTGPRVHAPEVVERSADLQEHFLCDVLSFIEANQPGQIALYARVVVAVDRIETSAVVVHSFVAGAADRVSTLIIPRSGPPINRQGVRRASTTASRAAFPVHRQPQSVRAPAATSLAAGSAPQQPVPAGAGVAGCTLTAKLLVTASIFSSAVRLTRRAISIAA